MARIISCGCPSDRGMCVGGANSPSLCPYHVFSYIDRDKLVAIVYCESVANKLGAIIEARLQVLITDFLPDSSIAATFFSSLMLI